MYSIPQHFNNYKIKTKLDQLYTCIFRFLEIFRFPEQVLENFRFPENVAEFLFGKIREMEQNSRPSRTFSKMEVEKCLENFQMETGTRILVETPLIHETAR